MNEDAMLEKMAEEIFEALKPLRHYHDEYDKGMSYEKQHEEAEFLLMKVVDKWYAAGFKDGAANERNWGFEDESDPPRAA